MKKCSNECNWLLGAGAWQAIFIGYIIPLQKCFFFSWPSQIIERILWSPSSILGNRHSWFKFAEFLASCWYYVQGWRRGQYWQEHVNAWLQLHVILELGTDGSTLKQYEREQGYWPSKYCSGLTHIPSTKVLGANKRWRQIYLLCVKMPHLNW